MDRIKQIQLPPSRDSADQPVLLDVADGPLVITGANGSGKTRLGAWLELESPLQESVHRIAAQKSLSMPSSASTIPIEDALDALNYGVTPEQIGQSRHSPGYSSRAYMLPHKRSQRWGNNPTVFFLNDFQKLMDVLHSDSYETSSRYLTESNQSEEKVPTPETQLMKLKRLWEGVLPHRELDVNSISIKAKIPGSATSYSGGGMSDGERAIFYLLGQCVTAREGSIIVIDEPELHIHRSIQGPLFDAIEAERPDCLIVYITHDLDFAASRVGAKMLWLKDYDGEYWDWELVPEQEGVPEQMLLNILGSRKRILLTEGDRSSLDYAIYSRAYPDRTVFPMGGCEEVLAATKTLRLMPSIHHLEPKGIIDRDYRSDQLVAGLKDKGIEVLDVHELEHLLLTEPVMTAVAESLAREDASSIVQAVQNLVFNTVETNFDIAATRLAANRIQAELSAINTGLRSESDLQKEFEEVTAKAAPTSAFAEASKDLREALDRKDYRAILKLYTDKGLVKAVASQFGFTSNNYVLHVKRLIARKDNQSFARVVQGELPLMN